MDRRGIYSQIVRDHPGCTAACSEGALGWRTATFSDIDIPISIYRHHSTQVQQNPAAWEQAQAALLATPPPPSFARRNPTYEGVCMGNRKTCKCGAAFFS